MGVDGGLYITVYIKTLIILFSSWILMKEIGTYLEKKMNEAVCQKLKISWKPLARV